VTDSVARPFSVQMFLPGGDHRGRRLWDRFMMTHQTSEKAVEIGRTRLASLCRAVGNPAPGDSSDLHGVPVTAIVGRETRKVTGEEVNRVKAYRPLDTPSRGGRPSGSPRRPWER